MKNWMQLSPQDGVEGGSSSGGMSGPQPVQRQPSVQPSVRPEPLPTHTVQRAPGVEAAKPKIRAFEQQLGGKRHEDDWKRTPNTTGTGAIHVRSFHCRMNEDGLAFLDQQVNEWLDAHPQYEVKFVQTAVGEWKGKTVEQNLIVQVWV